MLKKSTKTQVVSRLKQLEDGETIQITLCPSKCYPNPNSYVDMTMTLDFSKEDLQSSTWETGLLVGIGKLSNFDTRLNAFQYYNCTPELGKRVHFYIKETE